MKPGYIRDIEVLIEQYRMEGKFKLSGGGRSNVYYDLRAAILEHPDVISYFFRANLDHTWPVGTGISGALIIATIGGLGTLWNPKGHGVEWSGWPRWQKYPNFFDNGEVALVDDVKTTGGTLKRLRAACEARGWKVVKEIVLLDRSG